MVLVNLSRPNIPRTEWVLEIWSPDLFSAHHSDVEGIEQVEGQGSDEVHKKPGGSIMDAD